MSAGYHGLSDEKEKASYDPHGLQHLSLDQAYVESLLGLHHHLGRGRDVLQDARIGGFMILHHAEGASTQGQLVESPSTRTFSGL